MRSCDLIFPDLCLPNSPVDYRICGLMQEVCTWYKHLSATPTAVTSDLKRRLIFVCKSLFTILMVAQQQ